MTDLAMKKFSSAVDKMMQACREDEACRNILITKIIGKQTSIAVSDMDDVIESYKSTFEYDESDGDVQDFRSIQENIKLGNLDLVRNKYFMMDTLPREHIPDSVDTWIANFKSILKSF